MLNRIFIMGRLTRDPELRHLPSGVPVASFTLAVDRDFKNKETGEKTADFIDVKAWRSTADFVCKYFTKGRMAVVEGRLQIRDWTDREGNKRRSAEVVADSVYFGDSRRDSDSGGSYGGSSYGGGSYKRPASSPPPADSDYGAPPPASSDYGVPPPGGSQFSDFDGPDEELPF